MLGIIIGVASVISLVSIGSGSQLQIKNQIDSLGTNLIIIRSGSSKRGGIRGGAGSKESLSLQDLEQLNTSAEYVQYVSPKIGQNEQVIVAGENWNTLIVGVSPDYPSISNYDLSSGRFFTNRDVKIRAKVAIIGKTVGNELFPGQDPIGVRVRIRNVPFTVLGVLDEKGETGMGNDQDDVILIPYTTMLYRMGKGKKIKKIKTILVSAVSSEQMSAAEDEIRTILRTERELQDDEPDNFYIRNQSEINQMASEVTGTMTLLLSAVAGVSLLVGGIGIMNIMLVSVTERTREIGIRLAVGARSSDVLLQFLIEAVILSLIGGLIGIIAGLGLGYLVGEALGTGIVVEPRIIIYSALFAGLVGGFFGFYPAHKASTLNPIEALRYE